MAPDKSGPAQALVTQCFAARKKYIQSCALQAYRLFTQEEAELPLTVDIYGDNAVLHVFGQIEPEFFRELENALARNLHIKNLFYKNRTKIDLELPQNKPAGHREIIIQENGLKFLINLSDYLDTGLFLDHRETRKWIMAQSKGKIVLNTFAYTGSFSVYASAGGAEKTYSIDLSRAYCEWIKKNLSLNNLPPEKNWVYKMDTFEFFKYARKKALLFDIIIIDPPTFSRNKGKSFSVQRDHPKLITEAHALLRPGGFILFSNNFREFHMDLAALSRYKIKEVTNLLPVDFKGSIPHRCFVIE